MKKVELLSPVGNAQTLKQAIHNGADAVYLAGTAYGARAYADNFKQEELIKTIKYCHLYNVKIYITANTLIYQSEVNNFLDYIKFLHLNKVDAVIMQDIGMINLVKKKFPNLEIHASTQCHNHNEAGIKLLKDIGVTRVVIAREISLDDINNITLDIEKEIFVYGALCVCYSGCCLFSSLNGGRSGNRGECVGSCRLPYKLMKNNKIIQLKDKYLLSTKELNTIDYLDKILSSNIDSLKIEGRMKSPYYVGYITKLYRTLIDNYYSHNKSQLTSEQKINLKKLFNREFTKGYLLNESDIMNTKNPNHQGIIIGKVLKKDKKYIYIKLENDNLYREDGIRFKNSNKGMIVNKLYNNKLLLVNSINKGDIAIVDNKFNISDNDLVLKTIDKKLVNSLNLYDEKKIEINFDVKAHIGKQLEISISDNVNKITKYGYIVEKSISQEVDDDNIIKCLSKVGNTPFKLCKIDISKDDNIFISLKNINEVRRQLIEKLISTRENKAHKEIIINKVANDNYIKSPYKYSLNVLVRDEEQLQCCLNNSIDDIYVTNYKLYHKYKKYNNIFYRTSRVNNNYIDFNAANLLVTELGGIYKYMNNNNIVGDYYLNITNSESIKFLNSKNVRKVTLSPELSDKEISLIMEKNYNTELIIYGRLELMIMKYCPLRKNLNYCGICKNSKDKFYLKDRLNNLYPLIRENCLTHIMHHKNIDKISQIVEYKNMNIKNYRIELFDENYDEVEKLIHKVRNQL